MVRGGRGRAGALAVGAVAAVLLAGGCSASEERGKSAAADMAAPREAAPAAPQAEAANGKAAAPSAAPSVGSSIAPAVDAKLIAHTAQLALSTKNVPEVVARARTLATEAGGYVGSESVNGSSTPSGQLTLKVPSAKFEVTLDLLAKLGDVTARRSQAEDLTLQVADVNSRVQSQQASVERIRALMSQAKSLQEVTSLESELARRESDLESLQRRQKELAAKTSYSTITVDVRHESTPARNDDVTDEDGFWDTVGDGLSGGWDVLVAIVRGIAVVLAAVLPFLLVLGPVAAITWLLRRRRKAAARRAAVPPQPTSGPTVPETEAERED